MRISDITMAGVALAAVLSAVSFHVAGAGWAMFVLITAMIAFPGVLEAYVEAFQSKTNERET